MAVATTNKDFKQGWVDSYYPYGQYMVQENRLILGGDEIKVNNEILTQQVIRDSTSGYDKSSSIQQTGGRNIKKKYIKKKLCQHWLRNLAIQMCT